MNRCKEIGPHAHNVINVFVAVDVPQLGTFPPFEKQGNRKFCPPDLATDAARDHRIGALEKLFASLEAQ